MIKKDDILISVYLDDGRVFDYNVPTIEKAREHASAIVKGGYRSVTAGSGVMEHYPPHRILKVKVSPFPQNNTDYVDTVRGT
jgi:hypothetical protein